ncbi:MULTISPECIES: hypothetical protein [Streptomyces]|uniref:hypothetical protein n=1 Tax=Streptomyces TaxID=1883 RepID=UPI00342B0BE7
MKPQLAGGAHHHGDPDMKSLNSSQQHSPFGLVVASPGSAAPRIWTDWLLFMVPLFIAQMQHISDAQASRMSEGAADLIAEHGDDAQYGGSHQSGARTAIAKGLALLARAEGGVTALGIHACIQPHAGCPGRVNAAPHPTPEAKK